MLYVLMNTTMKKDEEYDVPVKESGDDG